MATEIALTQNEEMNAKLLAQDAQDAKEATLPELTKKEAKKAQDREEKSDLRSLERNIAKGEQSLTLMAEALTQIRDRKLFRHAIDPDTGKGYKAFAKYLLSHPEWGFTSQYANRLIANLRDQKAIEAGEEPEARTVLGPRELTANEAATKIAKAFGQFGGTIGKYRDAVDNDAFRADFDKAYAAVEKAMDAFIKRYPAPIEAKTVEAKRETDGTE